MSISQRFAAWFAKRKRRKAEKRLADLNTRVRESEEKTIVELRVLLVKKHRQLAEANQEIRDLQKRIKTVEEDFEHRLEMARRRVDLAAEENRLLAATLEADVARRESEAAIFLRKAQSMRLFSPEEEATL